MTRTTQLSSALLLVLLAPGCPQSVECRAEIDVYEDLDGDGFGSSLVPLGKVCEVEAGQSESPLDCDDADPLVFPEAEETCNGVDENCDGQFDEGFDRKLYHRDSDGDGFGGFLEAVLSCDPPEQGQWSRNDEDCDDADENINPDAQEVCGGPDEDCDGLPSDADDSVDPASFRTFYRDADGDGLGWPLLSLEACDLPAGTAENDDDCDDGDDLIGRLYWYADLDLDGFGDPAAESDDCRRPDGYVANNLDCDDTDLEANVDKEWYDDFDGDAFGQGGVVAIDCRAPSLGLVADSTDCDDTDDLINPEATDRCLDGVDSNCDNNDLCNTCKALLDNDPTLPNGLYNVDLPEGNRDILCDMVTDGGGWTLVMNSGTPGDFAASYYNDLQSLPNSGSLYTSRGVWDGLRDVTPERTDIRFTCGNDNAFANYDVDMSFYDIHWYDEFTTGTDVDSCFNEPGGYDQPAPARTNNLTGAMRPLGDDWNSGSLIGERSCGDINDFGIDFDQRGMASGFGWGGGGNGEATTWGVSDYARRCGSKTFNINFWMWVR